jgi:hypothetical protein
MSQSFQTYSFEYKDFQLAITYQELWNSQTFDIMQSFESIGKPPNQRGLTLAYTR